MCRLYGCLANEPTKVECTLVCAQNALLRQSHKDSRGRSNADGWGIAFYQNGMPSVQRKATAAFEDAQFSETAARIFSKAVIAHVRMASVGNVTDVNAHPFAYGCWSFAHNGGLTAFDAMQPQLEAETDSALQSQRRGTTDSEQIFYWLLSRMARAGLPLDQACENVDEVADIVAEAVRLLARRCDDAGATEPARLNFMLTDGVHLIATRWKNSLYCVQRNGIRDCEICGMPHVKHQRERDYRAVVVASEPISHEQWREIPEGAMILVDENISTTIREIDREKPWDV